MTLCSYLSNVYASAIPPLLWKLNGTSQVAETELFFYTLPKVKKNGNASLMFIKPQVSLPGVACCCWPGCPLGTLEGKALLTGCPVSMSLCTVRARTPRGVLSPPDGDVLPSDLPSGARFPQVQESQPPLTSSRPLTNSTHLRVDCLGFTTQPWSGNTSPFLPQEKITVCSVMCTELSMFISPTPAPTEPTYTVLPASKWPDGTGQEAQRVRIF